MRSLAQALPIHLRRGPLFAIGFFVFALLLAYLVAGYIIAGDTTSLGYVGVAFVGFAFVLAVLNNWRTGVYFFLGWLLFEDFARKFLGNNMAIYFAKDLLAAIVYLSFFMAYRRREKDLCTFRPPFVMALLVFAWFGVMQVFNPGSTSLFYGLLGMKLYFYYMPLVVIGYALIRSEADLRRFFYMNLSLMVLIAALGIVQAILGHKFLNPEVAAEDLRALSEAYRESPISGAIVYRPTSVFVSTGRFSNMLVVSWLIVFGFSGYLLLRHRRGRVFAFIALVVTAAGCVMCGARGVFMWSAGSGLVGAAAFVWGAPWRQREALRVIRSVQRAALGVTLGMLALLATYPKALLDRISLYTETLDPRSPASELGHRVWEYPVRNLQGAFASSRWAYGNGIGTVSLGGQYIMRIFHILPPTYGVESGFGNIVVEMGIVGLALWLVMSFAVLVCAWRVVRKLRGSPWFPLAFMIFWYAFLLLLPFTFQGLQAYQDFVLNAYLWLLLGILFRLPKLALSAQFAADAPAAGQDTNPRWIR
jgi:hypothetical protein